MRFLSQGGGDCALYGEDKTKESQRGADMHETDQYYVGRCLDGHSDDYRYLVRRYQGVLLAHLVGRLGDKERAEEAAQESLVRAYFNMDRLKKPESFFSWLLGIAEHVAKEHHRKDRIRQQRESIRSAMEKLEQPELSQDYALEAAIAELPEAYREVVLLRYYGNHSCNQIAERLAMPLGTVTKMLSRAYTMLRESLQQVERQGV